MKDVRVDATDRRILAILQEEGRLPNARIAERVGLSPPSVLERIRKLEERGVIKGYAAQVEGERLGLRTVVFVQVSLSFHRSDAIESFRKSILATPPVLECYHVTGEEDFLLKVVVPDIADYEDFLLHTLTQIEGIGKVKSSFVLSTLKRSSRLPLPEGA
jgi:Lrp/AsnC family leucine-responsive transcriptional regulator